ncbi:MAG: hypothetical protein J6U10_09060 [Lachnospiraceae bacterium]|nr:hypothetical protein [Lachnospiraceae bacterium]
MKLVFFDVDGTISAPGYPVDGTFKIGMDDDAWGPYCEAAGEDGYKYCSAVPAMIDYAEKNKKAGNRTFVLTAVYNDPEVRAKEKFIAMNYPGLFEEILTVSCAEDKIGVMRDYAAKFNVPLEDCELVDDTYSLLLKVVVAGMKATHTVNVCANYEKKLLDRLG